MTTELSAQERARIALREGEQTLTDVAAQAAAANVKFSAATQATGDVKPFPDVPETPMITQQVHDALVDLPHYYGKVVVDTRRSLTSAEIAAFYDEYRTLRTIGDTLKERLEVVKENIRTHIDVAAEEQGAAGDYTPRDDAGHFILSSKGHPTVVPIPGANEQFSLEFRAGRAGRATISSAAIEELYEDGELTRDQYLSLTREERVFDEAKATAAVVKDPSLVDVIAKAIRVTNATSDGTSLYLRKVKK